MADELLDAMNDGVKTIQRSAQEARFKELQSKVKSLEARLDILEGKSEENKPQFTKKK